MTTTHPKPTIEDVVRAAMRPYHWTLTAMWCVACLLSGLLGAFWGLEAVLTFAATAVLVLAARLAFLKFGQWRKERAG